MSWKKITSVVAASSIAVTALAGISAPAAQAAGCKGKSERVHVAKDFDNKMNWYDVKLNSCDANKFNDLLTQTGGASLALSALAAKFPSLGPAALVVSTWSYANQVQLSDCIKPGTGVTFHEVNGGIADCKAQ